MHSRILFVSVLFSILFALAAIATPQPDPLLVERGVSSVINNIPSEAASAVAKVSTVGKNVFESVISAAGGVFTVVTSKGGADYTLAPSGAGATTSVFGGIYTIATPTTGAGASASSNSSISSSSASVTHAGVQTPLLVGLGSMLVSALLGMMMTL